MPVYSKSAYSPFVHTFCSSLANLRYLSIGPEEMVGKKHNKVQKAVKRHFFFNQSVSRFHDQLDAFKCQIRNS